MGSTCSCLANQHPQIFGQERNRLLPPVLPKRTNALIKKICWPIWTTFLVDVVIGVVLVVACTLIWRYTINRYY